jgi:hypothetical protein
MPDGSHPFTEKDTVADLGMRAEWICSLREALSLNGGLVVVGLLAVVEGGGVEVCDEVGLSDIKVDCPSTAALALDSFFDFDFFFFVFVDFGFRGFEDLPVGYDSDVYVVGSC